MIILIISFIFLAISILYGLYTIIDYFKYSTPSIIYYKENEQDSDRRINMSDPFLFGLFYNQILVNESIISYDAFCSK